VQEKRTTRPKGRTFEGGKGKGTQPSCLGIPRRLPLIKTRSKPGALRRELKKCATRRKQVRWCWKKRTRAETGRGPDKPDVKGKQSRGFKKKKNYPEQETRESFERGWGGGVGE